MESTTYPSKKRNSVLQFNKRLSASSLLSTLILLLVLLIAGAVILLSVYYHHIYKIRDSLYSRLTDDLESARLISLSDTLQTGPIEVKDSVLLFHNEKDSLFYSRFLWGCFNTTALEVRYKNHSKKQAFFYGAKKFMYDDAVVYLSDNDRPLSVTGTTLIQGKAYLPKAGLRSGFFEQKGFSRKNLIEGEIANSNRKLPGLNKNFIALTKYYTQIITDTANHPIADFTDSLSASFNQPIKIIHLGKLGIIANKILFGKLIIVADSVLEIKANNNLKDVVFIAPYIKITDGTKGTLQCFALDSITIGENCNFKYPSAFVNIGRSSITGNTGGVITVKTGSVIEGVVIGLKGDNNNLKSTFSNIKSMVKLQQGATVKGLIYNEGYTFLSGNLQGAIFTDYFFEQRGPLSMENILVDASIIKSNWLSNSCYFSIFENAKNPEIIKWLN